MRSRPAGAEPGGGGQEGRTGGGQSGGHADAAARRRPRHPQQAERHRENGGAASRPVGALEGPDRAVARVRDDGSVGRGEAHRRLCPGRRPAHGQEMGARLLGLALQGIAVAQRRRAPGLRRVAQELRDDVSGGTSRARSACHVEQSVQRREVGRCGGRSGEAFSHCSGCSTHGCATAERRRQ